MIQLNVRVTEEDMSKLALLVKETGRPQSSVIRTLIRLATVDNLALRIRKEDDKDE